VKGFKVPKLEAGMKGMSLSAAPDEESDRESTCFDISYIGEETLDPSDGPNLASLRKALAVASKSFNGEIQEVTLELSTLGAKSVDRITGDEIETDHINTIKFMGTIKDGEGYDVLAYISEDTNGFVKTCRLYHLFRSVSDGAEIQGEFERYKVEATPKERKANPFQPYDGSRDKAPSTLFARQIHRADLKATKVLGAGQFGEVYKAMQTMKKKDGSKVDKARAVKLLKPNTAKGLKDEFVMECEMCLIMNHVNCVKMIGVCVQQAPWLCVLECMAYGDLLGLLRGFRARKSAIEISEAIHICLDIARGLEHMAACRLVHCDIACRNVLVDKDNVMKVADFGLTRQFNDGKDTHTMVNPAKMPIKWVAIEGLRAPVFSEATDMWSFGVTAWEVLTLGASPYIGVSIKEMYMKLLDGMRLEMPPSTPRDIWEVLETTWMQEPSDRMTFTGLIERVETIVAGNKKYHFKNTRDLGAVVATIEAPDVDFADLAPTSPNLYGAPGGMAPSMVMGRRGSKHDIPKCKYSGANGKCTAVINPDGGVKFCGHHLCSNFGVDGCLNDKSSRAQLCISCQEKAGKGAGPGGGASASSMGFGGGIGSQVRASKMLGGGYGN